MLRSRTRSLARRASTFALASTPSGPLTPRSRPIELEIASTSRFGAGSAFTTMGSALLASSISALGACNVCGSDIAMTFAAWVTETVGPPVAVTAAEAPSEAPTFGSLAFDSLPGVADPLDGVAGAVLGGDTSSAAFGGTRAADGGTEPTDAGDEVLVAAETDGLEGALVAGLWAVAVEVTDGASDIGATTRGAGGSLFVTGGFTGVEG